MCLVFSLGFIACIKPLVGVIIPQITMGNVGFLSQLYGNTLMSVKALWVFRTVHYTMDHLWQYILIGWYMYISEVMQCSFVLN